MTVTLFLIVLTVVSTSVFVGWRLGYRHGSAEKSGRSSKTPT